MSVPRPANAPTLDDDAQTGRVARLVVVMASGVAGIGLSWFVAQHSLLGARWRFVVLLAVWVPVGCVGAWAARKLPTRTALILVVGLAVLLRLAAATGSTPSISSDLYRYSWDAHVQASGIDPYRYPPDAPQLDSLHTPGYWPSPGECRHIGQKPGCTVLNRPGDRTIYPAVAEGWFVLVHLFDPGDSGSRPWQLAGGFVDDGAIVLLAVALRDRGKDPRAVAWYALSPLPVVEFAGNGHVDGFALVLMLGALVALGRQRRGWAGVLVGLAIMVKLYPAMAVVAGWRRGRWRFVAAAAAVCVATEAPHVIAVGTKVLGYIPGYLKEEHYSSGGRFLLLGLLYLPGHVTTGLAVLVVAGAACYIACADLEPASGLCIGLGVLMFVTTPVQPWYAVAVAGIAVLAGQPWMLVVALAAEPYYAAVILNDPHQVAIGRICYGAALLVVLAGARGSGRVERKNARASLGAPIANATRERPVNKAVRCASAMAGLLVAVAATAGCGSGAAVAKPLAAAPEPAVSPPAAASPPGTVLTIGGAPEGVAVDAGGEVALNVRHPDGVVLFSIGTPQSRRTIALRGSARHLMLADPSGPLLVPDESDDTLVELSVPDGRIVASVPVGRQPHDAVAMAAGTVLVSDELANTVDFIRAGRVVRVVPAPLQPGGVAANPDGTLALVVGVRARRITEYRIDGAVVGSANCGAGPTHVVAGDDGLYWVADTNGGAVLAFRLGPHGPVQVATIPVGSRPYGLAFDAARQTLWVTLTGSNQLVGLRLNGRSVVASSTFPTVRQSNSVAVDEATGEVVVTGSDAPGQVQLLDPTAP